MVLMDLATYQRLQRMSAADLAAHLGVTVQALHRYMHRGRIPESAVLERILRATDGQVTPNDFFALKLCKCA